MSSKTITILTITGAALFILGTEHAQAASLRTPPIQPGAEQKLVCTVVNDGKDLQMVAQIVDRFGDNATDFAVTDYDPSGEIVTTLHVESSNPNARYCRIVVTGGRKSDVSASLQACGYDGSLCGDPVVAR